MERLFTRAEAEALLPLLTELLTELRDKALRLEAIRGRLAELPETARHNGYAAEAARLEREAAGLMAEAGALIERVQGLGVEIKDIVTGLVDFRTLYEGRTVCLCWRLGEPSIGFWHELDTGFAGRRPLDE